MPTAVRRRLRHPLIIIVICNVCSNCCAVQWHPRSTPLHRTVRQRPEGARQSPPLRLRASSALRCHARARWQRCRWRNRSLAIRLPMTLLVAASDRSSLRFALAAICFSCVSARALLHDAQGQECHRSSHRAQPLHRSRSRHAARAQAVHRPSGAHRDWGAVRLGRLVLVLELEQLASRRRCAELPLVDTFLPAATAERAGSDATIKNMSGSVQWRQGRTARGVCCLGASLFAFPTRSLISFNVHRGFFIFCPIATHPSSDKALQ